MPAAIAGGAFALVATGFLLCSQPHEDAYILFRYAENLAAGHGLVFNIAGPRAEGATDFLWLVLIAALVRAGVNVAIAAALLNGVGAAIAARILVRPIVHTTLPKLWRLSFYALAIAAPLLLSCGIAALLGFSALLFSAVVLLLYVRGVAALGGSRGAVRQLPIIALVAALLRPDGAVIAVGFAIVGCVAARRSKELRRYAAFAGGCALAGVGYFAWRAGYFGLLWPLPFYVKTQGAAEGLPGALAALRGARGLESWVLHRAGPLPLLAGALILAAPLWRAPLRVGYRAELHRLCIALLPIGAFIVALAFVRLTQNALFRYEAPATLVLCFIVLRLTAMNLDRTSGARRLAVAAVAVMACGPALYFGAHKTLDLLHPRPAAIETFAPALGEHLPPTATIAVTEAGRIAYWSHCRVIDAAGLNDPRYARIPPAGEDIALLAPQVIFLGVGRAIDPRRLGDPETNLVEIDPLRLAAAVTPELRGVYERGLSSYAATPYDTVTVAAAILARAIVRDGDTYRIFALRYAGGLHQVLALRRDLPDLDALVDELHAAAAAAGERGRSYLEVRWGV